MTDAILYGSENAFREKLHDLLQRPRSDRDLLQDFVHAALYYAMTSGRTRTLLEWFRLQVQAELLSANEQTKANCFFLRGFLKGYASKLGSRRDFSEVSD